MARTIDNLGVEISTRYAEDRALYDETFIKETQTIPQQARVTVTSPAQASEFDILFELGKGKAGWALFSPPPKYGSSRQRLFAEQLIPRLGFPDMQEAQLTRLDAVLEEEKKKQPMPHEEETEKEKRILSTLLSNIHLYDRLLIDINSKRAQYQKG